MLFVADRLACLDVFLFKDGGQILQPNHDDIMVRFINKIMKWVKNVLEWVGVGFWGWENNREKMRKMVLES